MFGYIYDDPLGGTLLNNGGPFLINLNIGKSRFQHKRRKRTCILRQKTEIMVMGTCKCPVDPFSQFHFKIYPGFFCHGYMQAVSYLNRKRIVQRFWKEHITAKNTHLSNLTLLQAQGNGKF